jgi:hypothetical protein
LSVLPPSCCLSVGCVCFYSVCFSDIQGALGHLRLLSILTDHSVCFPRCYIVDCNGFSGVHLQGTSFSDANETVLMNPATEIMHASSDKDRRIMRQL